MALPGMRADISIALTGLPIIIATLISTGLLALLFARRHVERETDKIKDF